MSKSYNPKLVSIVNAYLNDSYEDLVKYARNGGLRFIDEVEKCVKERYGISDAGATTFAGFLGSVIGADHTYSVMEYKLLNDAFGPDMAKAIREMTAVTEEVKIACANVLKEIPLEGVRAALNLASAVFAADGEFSEEEMDYLAFLSARLFQ